MYTEDPEYNKETITSDKLFKLARRSKKPKIYNPKTNRMIVIDGSAYNVLIRDGYMHWKEEKVLVPPIHKKLVLDIAHNPEKSLLSLIDRKTSLLQVLLEVYNDYAVRKLLKIDWNSRETREWRNDILARFLNHPNLISSKHRPNALYDTFIKSNVLEPDHILALAQAL
ncbi:8177_t:CDS:2 [Cetraspora pellucida]|uniref:8177_t:CDS:1 n=1 Tax=Cetraspora pellucida TaxID=1433469 RepID=A0ACA9N7M5_9GLOM|nr:8177_t:CDS:2 [Cetraspora pellucida]